MLRLMLTDLVLWAPRKFIEFLFGVGFSREFRVRDTEA